MKLGSDWLALGGGTRRVATSDFLVSLTCLVAAALLCVPQQAWRESSMASFPGHSGWSPQPLRRAPAFDWLPLPPVRFDWSFPGWLAKSAKSRSS